jgi:hypothetical protein
MQRKDRRQGSLFETPPPKLSITPGRQPTLVGLIQMLLMEALTPSATVKQAESDDADHS